MKRRRAAGDAGDFGSDLPTEKTLIKLNRQVIRALQAQQRTEAQWADWMDHAFELEDINKNLVKIEKIYNVNLDRLIVEYITWHFQCSFIPNDRLATSTALFTSQVSHHVQHSIATFTMKNWSGIGSVSYVHCCYVLARG